VGTKESESPLQHLLINTNKWFSAVAEYAWQLALALEDVGDSVRVLAHAQSPLLARWNSHGGKWLCFPLMGGGLFGWMRALFVLHSLMKSNAKIVDNPVISQIVWVFEGREHTLCALHRHAFPSLWKKAKLVRLRGQAAPVRNSWLNRWVYGPGVDAVVAVADVVADRIPFFPTLPHAQVFPFCSTFSSQKKLKLDENFQFDSDSFVAVVVGRFDPVKGHRSVLQAFAQLFSQEHLLKAVKWTSGAPFRLVFAGRSENISAYDLVLDAENIWGGSTQNVSPHWWRTTAFGGNLVLDVIDEKLPGIGELMSRADVGVISSLDSEVICRVAVEFLQRATPLVSSDAGALPEVVNAEVGWIYPKDSPSELAATIALAYWQLQDKAQKKHLKQNCLVRGEKTFGARRFLELKASVLS
jgi:glycosyltransferase involved in cell wall biosynthesis